jgi:hypothetical protein
MSRSRVAFLASSAVVVDAAFDAAMKRAVASWRGRRAIRVARACETTARNGVAMKRRKLAVYIYFATAARGVGSCARTVGVACVGRSEPAVREIVEAKLPVTRADRNDDSRDEGESRSAKH